MDSEMFNLSSQPLTFLEVDDMDTVGGSQNTRGFEYLFTDFTLPTQIEEPVSQLNSLMSKVCYRSIYNIVTNLLDSRLYKI